VIGNIYKRRFEFHQRIDGIVNPLDALSLNRRKEFERKEGFAPGVVYVIGYFHFLVFISVIPMRHEEGTWYNIPYFVFSTKISLVTPGSFFTADRGGSSG
jgi:hypothetical protein